MESLFETVLQIQWQQVVMWLIGGILMLMLGMIGEYIGRIYLSINRYPQFVVRSITRGQEKEEKHEDHTRRMGA